MYTALVCSVNLLSVLLVNYRAINTASRSGVTKCACVQSELSAYTTVHAVSQNGVIFVVTLGVNLILSWRGASLMVSCIQHGPSLMLQSVPCCGAISIVCACV